MGKHFYFIPALMFIAFKTCALQVSVSTFQFKRQTNNYLDVSLRILSSKITYNEVKPNSFQASANVLITINRINENEIIAYEKYQLTNAPTEEKKDLLDLKRFSLAEGIYSLQISVIDNKDSTNQFKFSKNIDVKNSIILSDIFLSSYTKKMEEGPLVRNGYYLEPVTYNVVEESQRDLQFYNEIYFDKPDTLKDVIISFAICGGIEPSDSSAIFMQKFRKTKQAEVIPLIAGFDLNYLESGDYHLKVSVINQAKKILNYTYISFINRNLPADIAQNRNFNQSYKNAFVENFDSTYLNYCLLSLGPLHTNDKGSLLNDVIKKGSVDLKKHFLFKYWKENYPKTPQASFDYYMKVVRLVDEKFYNTVGHGFQTDRGHIYLKHGKPNKTIAVDDEANTPPYEIWYYHYLSTTNQSNVKFIFYSPQLNSEYALLHSTCYGERKNPRWEVELYKNAIGEQAGDIRDATRMQENFNRKARMLFDSQ